MPKSATEKCRQCAKLSAEQAIARHGPDGTGCWEGQKCHKRRTYYRNRDRYNKQRRKQYRVNQGATTTDAEVLSSSGEKVATQVVTIPVPNSVAAIVHFYRQNKTAPLHAIAAELFVNGDKVVMVEAVHTLGWTGIQVRQYMRDILTKFSKYVGEELKTYEAQVEQHPETCQIPDCPLHGG